MMFRQFENKHEEQLASELIATIDKGEKWIFEGADGCADFGGFIDRLFYHGGDTYGTYCACIFHGKLRIQIGFHTDMPNILHEELLFLMNKARNQVNTFTSIWYRPENQRLDEFIFTQLPWKACGHKTHELTFHREEVYESLNIPENVCVIPFSEEYLDTTCSLLDHSLSHTFDNPSRSVFLANKEYYLSEWHEKARIHDCCIMLEHGELVGVYILKGAEIDLLAIASDKQGRGLGKLLLHHVRTQIVTTRQEEPYLYCIERNRDALRFYLREGMKITGYSGYAYLEERTNK